jgi:putative ABC transport system permease protein
MAGMERTMLSPRWRKVLRDLWGNRARTILVVLSIAVGVFAVGMIAGSQVLFSRELNQSWASVNPYDAQVFAGLFDEEFLATVRNMPEVADADGRRSFGVRFKTSSDGDDWRSLQLFTYADYDDIRVLKIKPEAGAWPPPERGVLIERASMEWMGVEEGDVVTVEAPNGKLRELRVAGVVHDVNWMSPSWTGWAGGYIDPEDLEWFGLSPGFDELNLIVAAEPKDEEAITRIAEEVRDRVERSGRSVYGVWVPPPGKHPADEVVQPVILIMGSMGVLSLLVSGFLVFNTLQALLAQQVRQIGMMKAVGARNGQIAGVYYCMVLVFSFLALAVSIPLGTLAGNAMTDYMAGLINFDVTSYEIPLQVYAVEVGVGLVVPLLAALYPILSAVRTSAAKAMSDYGLSGGGFGRGFLDRVLERVRGLSRPMLLSLRNTFRRKGRLALTLATLTLGGAIFIAVFSVRASLIESLDDWLAYVDYDALVGFRRAYRIEQIEQHALEVPGVVAAEGWRFGNARRIRPDDSESEDIWLRAAPVPSDLVRPILSEGRWLLPEDENAAVINRFLLKEESDIGVGDDIVLKIEGDETTWRVVGIMEATPPAPMVYVNLPYFTQVVGGTGRAGVVFVVTERHDVAAQSELAKVLEKHFEDLGFQASWTQTSATERAQVESQFNVLVMFLLIMAVLLAVVGAIGLMGTMSLNVLERTREIGVMRAIGASDGSVLRIVVVEGIIIGVLSWLIGTLVALPLSRFLSDMVGQSIIEADLSYTFSAEGALLWLALVVILATLASSWPARNATRVTVRDVLAYE